MEPLTAYELLTLLVLILAIVVCVIGIIIKNVGGGPS